MSEGPLAVAVAATEVTVRVVTEDVMLERARRVVLLASLLLSCEFPLISFTNYAKAMVANAIKDVMETASLTPVNSRGGYGRGRGAAPPS